LLVMLEPQQRGDAFQGEMGTKTIAALKAASAGGDGFGVLAEMANLLMLEPAIVHAGPDKENNRLFVWPYLSERPLDTLAPGERVDLLRLVPAAEAQAMIATKKWTSWRLAIGADGIWHVFKKDK
jgi:hypothetical protein